MFEATSPAKTPATQQLVRLAVVSAIALFVTLTLVVRHQARLRDREERDRQAQQALLEAAHQRELQQQQIQRAADLERQRQRAAIIANRCDALTAMDAFVADSLHNQVLVRAVDSSVNVPPVSMLRLKALPNGDCGEAIFFNEQPFSTQSMMPLFIKQEGFLAGIVKAQYSRLVFADSSVYCTAKVSTASGVEVEDCHTR